MLYTLIAGGPQRFAVPDSKVPWSESFPEYQPPEYTAEVVAKQPVWADNPAHIAYVALCMLQMTS